MQKIPTRSRRGTFEKPVNYEFSCILQQSFSHNNTACNCSRNGCTKPKGRSVGHKLSSICDCSCQFVRQTKAFRIIGEQTFDKSPTTSSSSFLDWWSPIQSGGFVYLLDVFNLPARSTVRRTSSHVLPRSNVCVHLSQTKHLLNSSCGSVSDSNMCLSSSKRLSFGLHSR